MADASQEKIKLGYWSIRGLAQPIRAIAAYCGARVENHTFELGPGPQFSRAGWYDAKARMMATGGFPTANLPFLEHGAVKLTGSASISEYIARSTGHTELVGGDDPARIGEAAMWYDHCRDLGSQWTRVCYPGPMERVFNLAEVTYTDKSWDPVCKALRERPFLGGEHPILADFTAAEIIYAMLCCDEDRMLGGKGSDFQQTLRAYLGRMLKLTGQEETAIAAIETGWTFNNGNACNPQLANLELLMSLVNA